MVFIEGAPWRFEISSTDNPCSTNRRLSSASERELFLLVPMTFISTSKDHGIRQAEDCGQSSHMRIMAGNVGNGESWVELYSGTLISSLVLNSDLYFIFSKYRDYCMEVLKCVLRY